MSGYFTVKVNSIQLAALPAVSNTLRQEQERIDLTASVTLESIDSFKGSVTMDYAATGLSAPASETLFLGENDTTNLEVLINDTEGVQFTFTATGTSTLHMDSDSRGYPTP